MRLQRVPAERGARLAGERPVVRGQVRRRRDRLARGERGRGGREGAQHVELRRALAPLCVPDDVARPARRRVHADDEVVRDFRHVEGGG